MDEVYSDDPTITSQKTFQSPRNDDGENREKNISRRNSCRSSFIPTTNNRYLEGAEKLSPLSSLQKDRRNNQFSNSRDDFDDTQLQVTDEESPKETDDPEAQGVNDDSDNSSSDEENDAELKKSTYYPPNGMKMDRDFVSSGGLMGIKYEDKTQAEGVSDPAVGKTNKNLRRATNMEKEMWNRKLKSVWKNEIEERNHLLVVPRAAFTLRKT
jgi:hypothetical protein